MMLWYGWYDCVSYCFASFLHLCLITPCPSGISKNVQALQNKCKEWIHTSANFPPLPTNSLTSPAKLSPAFSSSILLLQSSFPVHITTCSAYAAIVPLRLLSLSISSPSGSEGVGAQEHVGEGHVSTVGNGGALEVVILRRVVRGMRGGLRRHDGRRRERLRERLKDI
jgi:hypothetical protein